MKIRIGDRYRRIATYSKFIGCEFEVVELTDVVGCSEWARGICIKPIGYDKGIVDEWDFGDSKSWEYLGNYAKSENFTSLYSILCE